MKLEELDSIKNHLRGQVFNDGEQLYFYDKKSNTWKSYRKKQATVVLRRLLLNVSVPVNIMAAEAKQVLEEISTSPEFYNVIHDTPTNLINCRNGVLDLDNMEFKSDTEDFFRIQVDMKYISDNGKRTCEEFKKFLIHVFDIKNDSEVFNHPSVKRLMEVLGYLISNEYRAKKLMIILGPANSGKSQVLRLLRKVIGEENTVALTLDELSGHGNGRFRTALLAKAHALINDELPTTGLKNLSELKKIIAGEPIIVEAKGANPIMMENRTKMIFAGNQLPELKEADCGNAFVSRFCLIVFKKSVLPGEKKINLAEDLYKERDAIFSRAIDEYCNARKRKLEFTLDKDAEDILKSYKEENASVITFINDEEVIKEGEGVHTQELYRVYLWYCEKAALTPVRELKSFRQQLLSIPKVKQIRKKRLDGDVNPCSVVCGIELVNSMEGR